MSNTILQVEEDNTVSEDDGDSASSKGSANKGKLLGKRDKTEDQIKETQKLPINSQKTPIFPKILTENPNNSQD